MTKQKQLDYIYKVIPSGKNIIRNKNEWEQWVEIIFIWDIVKYYRLLPHAEVWTDNSMVMVNIFDDLSEPIDKQSNICIEYIYNLIK